MTGQRRANRVRMRMLRGDRVPSQAVIGDDPSVCRLTAIPFWMPNDVDPLLCRHATYLQLILAAASGTAA